MNESEMRYWQKLLWRRWNSMTGPAMRPVWFQVQGPIKRLVMDQVWWDKEETP